MIYRGHFGFQCLHQGLLISRCPTLPPEPQCCTDLVTHHKKHQAQLSSEWGVPLTYTSVPACLLPPLFCSCLFSLPLPPCFPLTLPHSPAPSGDLAFDGCVCRNQRYWTHQDRATLYSALFPAILPTDSFEWEPLRWACIQRQLIPLVYLLCVCSVDVL